MKPEMPQPWIDFDFFPWIDAGNWHVKNHRTAHRVGMKARERIGNPTAKVVADNIGSIEPKCLGELVHVLRHGRRIIATLRWLRSADATQVNGDNPVL